MCDLTTRVHLPPGSPPVEWYRFYEVTLALAARRRAALEDFARVYGAFRISAPPGAPAGEAASLLACCLDTDETGRGQVVLDGIPHPVADDDAGSAYALSLIFNRVAARSHARLFLHAAAVSVAGRALPARGALGGTANRPWHGPSAIGERSCSATTPPPLELASGTVATFPVRCPEQPPAAASAPVAAVFLLHPPTLRRSVRLAAGSPAGRMGASAALGRGDVGRPAPGGGGTGNSRPRTSLPATLQCLEAACCAARGGGPARPGPGGGGVRPGLPVDSAGAGLRSASARGASVRQGRPPPGRVDVGTGLRSATGELLASQARTARCDRGGCAARRGEYVLLRE